MYRNSWACALQLRSHSHWSPHTLEPVLPNRRSHCNEKPLHRCRRVAHAAVTIQHRQKTNQLDLLQLLMSGCQSLQLIYLSGMASGSISLEAPRIFLVGSQGCEPLTKGLESLPFTKSALCGFDILFCFISLPRLIGNGVVWWGWTQMDTELFPAERTRPKGRMEKDGHGRKHEGSCWADFVVNHCGLDSSRLWSSSMSAASGCLSWGLFLGEGEERVSRLRQIDN